MTTTEFSTPEALLARLDAQGWMPLVRIGEALTSLGMITETSSCVPGWPNNSVTAACRRARHSCAWAP